MVIRRGEVWWANLPVPEGSEPGFRRPVVIIQANSLNASGINTVIVAIVTQNIRLAEAHGNVLLSTRDAPLHRACVVNVSQVLTIDKSRLSGRVGFLEEARMQEISAGLAATLGLTNSSSQSL